jgi:hypothetical protein
MGEQAQQAPHLAVVESCEDRDLAGVCALQKPVESDPGPEIGI